MAVAPTGRIFNGFEFDGESSKNYSVYITGEAVYNAPEREVEIISIPGRNGSFALDKGRFENIEVTYPAGIFADNELDFARAVSNLRNYLCSKKGYCRLTDDYNPDEYRLAIYKSGLEVDPAQLKAGEFDITFDCKPQRFLMSGETPMEVDDGDVILNPTLFEAHPLLEVEGHGTVVLNGSRINIANAVMGNVVVADTSPMTSDFAPGGGYVLESESFSLEAYGNAGDDFAASIDLAATLMTLGHVTSVSSASITTQPSAGRASCAKSVTGNVIVTVKGLMLNGQVGTDATASYSCVCSITYKINLGETKTSVVTLALDVNYSASTGVISVTVSGSVTGGYFLAGLPDPKNISLTVNSTVSILGHPTYIDCDIGEAYKIVDDVFISLNRYIDLGSDLPKLAVGNTEISYDNTITDLQVIPRWWKV